MLEDLGGLPVLGHVIRRAQSIRELADLVLATTTAPEDDALQAYADSLGVRCYRGSISDVSARVLGALDAESTHFLRLNGDSPFLDADLASRGIQMAAESGAHLISNLPGRAYPYGIAVEVVEVAHFRRLMATTTDSDAREHVTKALYDDSKTRIIVLPGGEFPRIRTVVDTSEDLETANRVADLLGSELLTAPYQSVAAAFIRAGTTPRTR